MLSSSDFLHRLLSLPTAPYRETAVKAFLTQELSDHGIPFFEDPVGNLIVGAESKADYLSLLKDAKAEPLRVFIAHMDHPGFHGKKWLDDETLEVEWFGGSPYENCEGADVKLHAHVLGKGGKTPYEKDGKFTNVVLASHGRAMKTAHVKIVSSEPALNLSGTEGAKAEKKNRPEASDIFGYLSFRQPLWIEDEILYSKCCDDLIGVYAIVEAAKETYAGYTQKKPISSGKKAVSKKSTKAKKPAGKKPRPPFLGLITRAEEVGFIGTIGHFELGWLHEGKRPRFVVSLETSRTLPQADIGKGPILRLGDYMSVFDSALTYWMVNVAGKVLPGETQKRVMDGGRCEGSAALTYGFRTIALSVPLGNYHNQSFQGGPDARHPNGPAPEFVAMKDVERLRKIVHALITEKVNFSTIYDATRKSFKTAYKNAKTLLKDGEKG